MDIHERFMHRAIELAKQGLGHTRSNPLVGCVIVHQNKIIGEGYHYKYGGPHAEIVAINSVKEPSLLSESTMYVTLEPCSHYGKTPPCTNSIISEKIPRVFIASCDPNPLVNHNGIKQLKEAGILVKTGILEAEYRHVNRRFFTFHEKKRPYVILKWAQSIDGFIAPTQSTNNIQQYWISNNISKTLVHKWRSEEMAILVGAKTIINDNPQLTVRLWKGENPIRIFIYNKNKIPESANIYKIPPHTIGFTSNSAIASSNHCQIFVLDKHNFLKNLLHKLYQLNIVSLIVEGGSYTLQQFINENLWDEARIITGDIKFFNGVTAPEIHIKNKHNIMINNDMISIAYNHI